MVLRLRRLHTYCCSSFLRRRFGLQESLLFFRFLGVPSNFTWENITLHVGTLTTANGNCFICSFTCPTTSLFCRSEITLCCCALRLSHCLPSEKSLPVTIFRTSSTIHVSRKGVQPLLRIFEIQILLAE